MLTPLLQSLDNDYTPVQILDGESFEILFTTANPMRVSVQNEKRATRFQVEDGGERSDHIIDNAIEVSIEFILSGHEARQQFQLMRQAYEENRLVTVQTRMSSYENMLMESFPHEETPTMYDGVALPVRFVEWREVEPEYGELTREQVADPAQSSTVVRGTQTGSEATEGGEVEQQGSVLSGWSLI